MEFYSIVKKNETIKRLGKWTDIKDMKLSEVTQSQKDKKKKTMFSLRFESQHIVYYTLM